ncbi:hypothetical protein N7494_006941 [Penicillium frequentans]|uniref:Uncharacterized protein n=1 Tax=Penicillium frequentans TaxID=3151616 RepID=A0AAD6GE82_9EURO|nr:hypothetical protein N7494_006941 [Penicillium glabrum]
MRAYSPVLAEEDISIEDSLDFIDKLNEVFIASPGLQMAGLVAGAMTVVLFHPVQLAGVGVQIVSGAGSAIMSYTRMRLHMRTVNQELFEAHGLYCTIVATRRMTANLGLSPEGYAQFWVQVSEPDHNVHKIFENNSTGELGEELEEELGTEIWGTTP